MTALVSAILIAAACALLGCAVIGVVVLLRILDELRVLRGAVDAGTEATNEGARDVFEQLFKLNQR